MPHKNNYIDLDSTYKDEAGDQLLRITYELTENESKIDDFLLEKNC